MNARKVDPDSARLREMAAELVRPAEPEGWVAILDRVSERLEVLAATNEKLERAVVQAAEAGIDSFLEYRDSHGYDEDEARAKALLEVGDGARAIREIEEYEAAERG